MIRFNCQRWGGIIMESSHQNSQNNPWVLVLAGVILLTCILVASFLFGGLAPSSLPGTSGCTGVSGHEPVFADPSAKLRELRDPHYTQRLFAEAVMYEPLLTAPGTQVHMGFYSAKGNHGSLLRLLDSINDIPDSKDTSPNRAIWAQGVGYYPYPLWEQVMNEHWYERANAVNGTVMIFGKPYQDPHPVTFEQADAIWAAYSVRFAEMAELIAQATGRPVKAWCYVEGAKPNRIFYNYEFQTLKKLEKKGLVEIYFAKTQQAEWNNPEDWLNGSVNVPIHAP